MPDTYDVLAQGAAFKTVRMMYGLTMGEVARGWGIRVTEVSDLERGYSRFATPADMQAALSQIWLWAVEKNPRMTQ